MSDPKRTTIILTMAVVLLFAFGCDPVRFGQRDMDPNIPLPALQKGFKNGTLVPDLEQSSIKLRGFSQEHGWWTISLPLHEIEPFFEKDRFRITWKANWLKSTASPGKIKEPVHEFFKLKNKNNQVFSGLFNWMSPVTGFADSITTMEENIQLWTNINGSSKMRTIPIRLTAAGKYLKAEFVDHFNIKMSDIEMRPLAESIGKTLLDPVSNLLEVRVFLVLKPS